MESVIYSYKSPSGKYYIGQTINEDKRKYEHKMQLDKCVKFNNAITKYGFENFEYTRLFKLNIENEEHLHYVMDRLEVMLIKRFNSYERGYNMTKGGKGQNGLRHSEETKKRISKIKKETSKRGEAHHMWGTTMREDHPAKKFWFEKGNTPHNVTPILVENLETHEKREFETMREASKFSDCASSSICKSLKHKDGKVKNFKFSYIERSTTIESAEMQ
jgi:group I intron endonuclease